MTSLRKRRWWAVRWRPAAACPRPSTSCSCRRSITSGYSNSCGDSPLDWQQAPTRIPRVFASPAFAGFQALENKIAATGGPARRLKVSPAAWQAGVGSVIAEFTAAETTARLGVTSGETHAGDIILLRLILVGGAGLLVVIISSVLLLRFGNRITRELTGLRNAARALAGERLPSVVQRLRAGDDVDVEAEAPPLDLSTRTREVTETADAFSAVQQTAIEAAVEQAQLRKGVSSVFRSLARRNQSLLQRQLRMLDEMERGTQDPDALAQLFRLDHLTTRMRRQAEGLIILSGAAPAGAGASRSPWSRYCAARSPRSRTTSGSTWSPTRRTSSRRGRRRRDPPARGADRERRRLLAARHPRPGPGRPGGQRLRDRGRGPRPRHPARDADALNERLAQPPEFDLADSDQLGLFVVSRLAARQRDQGLAARVGLRRHDRHRADAAPSRRDGGAVPSGRDARGHPGARATPPAPASGRARPSAAAAGAQADPARARDGRDAAGSRQRAGRAARSTSGSAGPAAPDHSGSAPASDGTRAACRAGNARPASRPSSGRPPRRAPGRPA